VCFLQRSFSMTRVHHRLLIATFLPLCWLAMQAVHELGHVVGAWSMGGTVTRVVLHPLTISRTDLGHNPRPLVVVWAGPLAGVLAPLAAWFAVRIAAAAWDYLVRFFAGFCLIANGAYIGAGAWNGVGDCGEMLRHGTPIGVLWLFGLLAVASGLWLWHGLGPSFGFGRSPGVVDRRAAYASCGLLILTIVVECILHCG